MSKDNPDAVEELKKGLGHLFNAAKSAVHELPTKDLEEAVLTGVKEVGRALGNVKDTLENELRGKAEKTSAPPPAASAAPSAPPAAADASSASPAPVAPVEASPAAPEQTRIADEATKPAAPSTSAASPPNEPDTGGGI